MPTAPFNNRERWAEMIEECGRKEVFEKLMKLDKGQKDYIIAASGKKYKIACGRTKS